MKKKKLLSLALAITMLFSSSAILSNEIHAEAVSHISVQEKSNYILPVGGAAPIKVYEKTTPPKTEKTRNDSSFTSDIGISASESLLRRTQSKYMYSCLAKYKNGAKMQKLYNDLLKKMESLWYASGNMPVSDSGWGDYEYFFYCSNYGLTVDEAMFTATVFLDANPMMFFAEKGIWSSYDSVGIEIKKEYVSSSVRRNWDKKIKNYINSFSSALSGKNTLYHKALAIHDTLIRKTTYAFVPGTVSPVSESWAHDITGPITKNSAVCEGYSRAYELLLNYYGGNCSYSHGFAFSSGGGGAHAWNIVQLDDGNYYFVDTTWDDPVSTYTNKDNNLSHDYFAVGTKSFYSDHTPDSGYNSAVVPSNPRYGHYIISSVPSSNFSTSWFSKHTHSYIKKVVAPTCTRKGYTLYTCKTCGKSYKDNYKAATGHKFSDWKIVKAATPTTRGTMSRKCSICGNTQTKPVIYYERLAGANRYATAAALSKKSYTSSSTVVLASGMDYHDALAAVPLSKAYNAPLLLTAPNSMPKETLAEIKRLKATRIVLVYTKGQIGSKVISALSGYSKETVTGNSFSQTAANVANKLKSKVKPTTVFFVYANGFADALSASHIAAIKNAPIIYVNTNGAIDSASKAYLASVKGTIKNAFIIGGTGVISDSMKKTIAAQLPKSKITRFGGANRYETNRIVNNAFKANLIGKDVSIATGKSFPDALCGGLYAANKKIPLVLADQVLSANQKSFLKARKAVAICVIGGTGVVPAAMVQAVRDASA